MIASVPVFLSSALPRLHRAASSSYALLTDGSRTGGSRKPQLGPTRTPEHASGGRGHLSGTLLSPLTSAAAPPPRSAFVQATQKSTPGQRVAGRGVGVGVLLCTGSSSLHSSLPGRTPP